ncbi:PadR family transcriptional regulator [Cohnella zeiphila]|uniref:PadR family transcriptional regulator n=1 Tax=Cohnella zeiphila TaxID=2761120 RepID=A0A7X0VUS1_9BACL|nr:PadR family transcriptional regulator [Cohnella zeiphila]MBB6731226.1 PadR family transcriptional regulator [Cohnella zeiphila]
MKQDRDERRNGAGRDEPPFCGNRRYFGRGGVKYALLELLAKEPMHGYQMMKALEEQSGGMYMPSAGSIYPTLQMLEDRSLIEPAESEGKKAYRITEEGLRFLRERSEDERRGPFGEAAGTDEEEERIARWRREKYKRKLGIGDGSYEIVRKLSAAERAAEGDGVRREELDRLIAKVDAELEAFLAGVPEEGGA